MVARQPNPRRRRAILTLGRASLRIRRCSGCSITRAILKTEHQAAPKRLFFPFPCVLILNVTPAAGLGRTRPGAVTNPRQNYRTNPRHPLFSTRKPETKANATRRPAGFQDRTKPQPLAPRDGRHKDVTRVLHLPARPQTVVFVVCQGDLRSPVPARSVGTARRGHAPRGCDTAKGQSSHHPPQLAQDNAICYYLYFVCTP